MLLLSGLLVALIGQSSAGDAGRQAEADRLAACLEQIETDAEAAYEDGLAWINEGGRPFAKQCTALALIELGHAAEGAIRLEELANADDAGSLSQRIVYLAQSGNAWLVAGQPEAALVTLGNAIRLSPSDPQLKADRATALMALDRWSEAAPDLDEALQYLPADGGIRRLRAETRLNLGDLKGAREDVLQAIELDLEDVEAHVLHGRIKQAEWAIAEDPPAEEIIRAE